MRILLDECVPLRLSRELPDHEVRSVPEMGWASQENYEEVPREFATRIIDQHKVAKQAVSQ
jgi:hypothetical protein